MPIVTPNRIVVVKTDQHQKYFKYFELLKQISLVVYAGDGKYLSL